MSFNNKTVASAADPNTAKSPEHVTTMKYGARLAALSLVLIHLALLVRLGSSGLKVSKLILGCMSYGNPGYQSWILSEEEGFKHIKAAYDAGINTFDTADVGSLNFHKAIAH